MNKIALSKIFVPMIGQLKERSLLVMVTGLFYVSRFCLRTYGSYTLHGTGTGTGNGTRNNGFLYYAM